MTNEIWVKSSEREAFNANILFAREFVAGEHYDEFTKLLATYRKRAFDAGVFESKNRNKVKNESN